MPWSERFSFALRQIVDRGRGLSGFLSKLSAIGLVLAVAVLLTVLSVMNGFEREMRERILGLVPHVTVRGFAPRDEWQQQALRLSVINGITRTSLFAEREVLAVRGTRVTAARLLGLQAEVLEVWRPLISPPDVPLKTGQLLLGKALAKRLGVTEGDRLQLILPAKNGHSKGAATTAVSTVVGIISSGTELDEGLMIGAFDDVSALGRSGAGLSQSTDDANTDDDRVSGIALQLSDLFAAPRLRWDLARTLPPTFYVVDWTGSHGNLYSAIQLSRDLITLLLLSIIAVAAFNVVSSLVLVVTDRQAAIAMLRALGATGGDILWIFLLQGLLIGVIGASTGLLIGMGLAEATPVLASGLEWVLGIKLLNTDVYPLSFLPVDVRWQDALWLWSASVILCLLAAVIPARKAARLPVAQILASQST